jgi:hypothetical protein
MAPMTRFKRSLRAVYVDDWWICSCKAVTILLKSLF